MLMQSKHNLTALHTTIVEPPVTQNVPKTSILMPGDVQIHRQVLLSNTKISKKIKLDYVKYSENMMQQEAMWLMAQLKKYVSAVL